MLKLLRFKAVKKWTGCLLAALLLMLPLMLPKDAAAHAYIVESVPASGQTLSGSPEQAYIVFNEAIDPSFFELNVTGQEGNSVNAGKAAVAADNPAKLYVQLQPSLPQGIYTIHWRAISGDGHPVSGSIPFIIGQGSLADGGPSSSASGSGSLPGADQTVVRWLLYGGLMLFGGMAAAALWLFPRRFSASVFELPAGKRLLVLAFVLTAAAILLSLPLQVRLETGTPWLSLWRMEWFRQTLKSTSFGGLWWIQALLLFPLAFFVYTLLAKDYAERRRQMALWTLVMVLGIAAVKANIGHPAAAEDRWLASAADFIHLSAASVWLGGLLVLVFLLPKAAALDESGTLYGTAVRRFSATGALCAALLIASGIYGSFMYLPDLGALSHSLYGAALIAKAALVLLMLLLAWSGYRRGKLGRRLGRAAKIEWTAGIAALLVAGLLTNLSPGAPQGGPVHHVQTLGKPGYTVTVDISPAAVGSNHIKVSVAGKDGQPADVQQITVKLTSLAMDMDPLELDLTANNGFAGDELLTMSGKWRADVHVLLKSLDSFDGSFTFKAAANAAE